MRLTEEQVRAFLEEGVLVAGGVVGIALGRLTAPRDEDG